jgi:hypothetical protein
VTPLPGEVVVVVAGVDVGVDTVMSVVALLELAVPPKFSSTQNAKPLNSWQDEPRIGFYQVVLVHALYKRNTRPGETYQCFKLRDGYSICGSN